MNATPHSASLPFLKLLLLCISITLGYAAAAQLFPGQALARQTLADPPPGSHMLTANIYAADVLASMLPQRLDPEESIVVSNLVNMENFDGSSAFGRISAQQIASRLGQHGFSVLESRLAAGIHMDSTGEYMLTRDASQLLQQEYSASAVLVGVYTVAGDKVFVSTRIVYIPDNRVLAAYEYYLPLQDDTAVLIYTGRTRAGNESGRAQTWSEYALREQVFSKDAAPPNIQRKFPAQPAQQTPNATTPQRTRTTPLPKEPVILPGGKIINPAAPPAPLPKAKKAQRPKTTCP